MEPGPRSRLPVSPHQVTPVGEVKILRSVRCLSRRPPLFLLEHQTRDPAGHGCESQRPKPTSDPHPLTHSLPASREIGTKFQSRADVYGTGNRHGDFTQRPTNTMTLTLGATILLAFWLAEASLFLLSYMRHSRS